MIRPGVLAAVALLAGACQTTDLPPVTAGDYRVEADEQALRKEAEEEQARLDASGLVLADPAVTAYLEAVARRLAPAGAPEVLAISVRVVRDPLLNAFAFPTGRIYVHTGLLARMDDEAQLAALLAHEMTHATHRHAVKQFRDLKNKAAFAAGLGAVSLGVGGLLGSLGAAAAVTGYSRDLEREADTVGLSLVAAAGYDLDQAAKLFDHLKADLEEEKRSEPFFFGTHPRVVERIESYRALLAGPYRDRRPGRVEAEAFLAAVAPALLENARLELARGRFDAAERSARRYLAAEPAGAPGYFLLGEAARQRPGSDSARALAHYRRAAALDPSYADPHRALGLLLLKRGDRAEARAAFARYLALAPSAPDRAYVEAYLKELTP